MSVERIPYIDLGAGVMILWLIVYHALGTQFAFELYGMGNVTDLSQLPAGTHAVMDDSEKIKAINPAVWFPYLHFYLPWFFYKSGQFFTKRKTKELLKKDNCKLLRPFIIWSAVGYVLHLLFGWIGDTLTFQYSVVDVLKTFLHDGYVKLNLPLWFLITLIGVRMIANYLLPDKEDKCFWVKIITIIIIGYLISFAAYQYEWHPKPVWIANGAAGLAFFAMGYSLHKYEMNWRLLLPCLFVYVACCIWGFSVVGMKGNELFAGMYMLNMPECLCGIVVFNGICRIISRYMSNVSRIFEYVGRYSMIIYVTHGLIFISIQRIFDLYHLTDFMPYSLWIIMATYALFLPPICCISYVHSKSIL